MYVLYKKVDHHSHKMKILDESKSIVSYNKSAGACLERSVDARLTGAGARLILLLVLILY